MSDHVPTSKSNEDLRDWSDEHLGYEVWMMTQVVAQLASLPAHVEGESVEVTFRRNALVESFAVHFRCLRDFLFGARLKDHVHTEDAYACDFCEPRSWQEARESIARPEIKRIDSDKRVEREIVHLSFKRSSVNPNEKEWNTQKAISEFGRLLQAFAEKADDRLGEKARLRIDQLVEYAREEPDTPSGAVATPYDVHRLRASATTSVATSPSNGGGTIHPETSPEGE